MRPSVVGLLALVCVASSCVTVTLETLPLSVTLEPNKTTSVPKDTVVFVIKAEGAGLINLEADYGDGVVDTYNTVGARTASVTFKHVFAAAGTYLVTATANDVSQGSKKATAQIRVN